MELQGTKDQALPSEAIVHAECLLVLQPRGPSGLGLTGDIFDGFEIRISPFQNGGLRFEAASSMSYGYAALVVLDLLHPAKTSQRGECAV